jgi:formiminoglutamase
MITGVNSPSPNGLYPEEACQLMRFAGMSPNVKCMSLHGFNSENDKFDLTVKNDSATYLALFRGV